MSHRRTPEYQAWVSMRKRVKHSPYYINRITICSRWLDSFDDFLSDVGLRPSPVHSLDRIDNDGNYEPSNCRWATRKEQMNNRRRQAYKQADGRYIYLRPNGSFQLLMRLPSGQRFCESFTSYEDAVEKRALIEYERTMYIKLLGH